MIAPLAQRASQDVLPRVSHLGDSKNGRIFRLLLSAFVLVAVAKIHEAVPQLHFIPWVKVAGVVMLGAAISAIPAPLFRRFLRTRTARWIAVVVVLALAGAPFALWKAHALSFVATELWKPLVLFAVAAPAFTDTRTMRAAVVAFVIGAGLHALRVASGFARAQMDDGVARFSLGGTFDSNESALLFLVAVPFALELAAERGKARWYWYPIALVLVAGIIRTGSRAGFLGLCAVTAWWGWRTFMGRAKARTVLVVAGALVVVSITATTQLRERFLSVLDFKADYNFTHRDGRWQVWQRGVGYMMRNPVLGVGIANFPVADGDLSGKANVGYGIKYSEAHNSFIQVGAELGILGLVAFTAAFWTAYRGCRRLRKHPHAVPQPLLSLGTAAEGAMLALLVSGSFLSFAYQMVTFFILAVATGVSFSLETGLAVHPAPAPAGPGQAAPRPVIRFERPRPQSPGTVSPRPFPAPLDRRSAK